jgi:ribosomal protein S17E
MALCNIAFCYSQISNGKKSEYYYNVTLKEFPNNNLAVAALNMMNSSKLRNE